MKFYQDKLKYSKTVRTKPILNVSRVVFQTKDKNWVNRLLNSSLFFKVTCLGENNKKRKTSEESLNIGAFITPYSKNPDLIINKHFSFFEDNSSITPDSECIRWNIAAELNNFSMKENESLEVTIIDTDHVQKEINNWIERIANLYLLITDWLSSSKNYAAKLGRPVDMYEEMMQNFGIKPTKLNTLDIYLQNRLVMSFKPNGLWTIGLNGKIDIISTHGSYILGDKAEQFTEPKWYIFTSRDKTVEKPFTKNEFLKLIK